jgi:hypothetical protein
VECPCAAPRDLLVLFVAVLDLLDLLLLDLLLDWVSA